MIDSGELVEAYALLGRMLGQRTGESLIEAAVRIIEHGPGSRRSVVASAVLAAPAGGPAAGRWEAILRAAKVARS